MIETVLRAGLRLAEALDAENRALAALDLDTAVALAPAKSEAADAFAAARDAATKAAARAEGQERTLAEQLGRRLEGLAAENRRLLERAITLQAQVIETIAGAALPAANPGTYGRLGERRAPIAPAAIAFAARV
jgi:hypothetical protein